MGDFWMNLVPIALGLVGALAFVAGTLLNAFPWMFQ